MWQLIKGLAFDAVTALLTVGLYIALANGLTMYFSQHVVWYDLVNGLNDTQMIFCILCFWNMFFGPYSRLLRAVAKYLPKRRKTQGTEDYT